jgi:hypothetical protein
MNRELGESLSVKKNEWMYKNDLSSAHSARSETIFVPTASIICRLKSEDSRLKPTEKTPWPESAIELYRSSDRRLSMKLVSTFPAR